MWRPLMLYQEEEDEITELLKDTVMSENKEVLFSLTSYFSHSSWFSLKSKAIIASVAHPHYLLRQVLAALTCMHRLYTT